MNENNDPVDFDFADMRDIDNRILAEMNKPGLVDHMQEDSEKREAQKTSWMDEFRKDTGLYFFLTISAVFTSLLGIMLGLAPVKQVTAENVPYIRFNTDWVHIVITILLVVGFVGVTEVAYAIGKRKHHTREEANPTQRSTSWAVMAIAFVSIIVTGITGGIITASVLGFLSDFSQIPHGAQLWAAIGIPLLIAFYAVLLTAYNLSSEAAKTERITRDRKRKMDLENKTRMDNIRSLAGVKLQYAEIRLFWQKVNEGIMTAAEANAAIMAGETLMQTERRLGRDLNGDRQIGDNNPRRPALPVSGNVRQHEIFKDMSPEEIAALVEAVSANRNGQKVNPTNPPR